MKSYYAGLFICLFGVIVGCSHESSSAKQATQTSSDVPVETSIGTVPESTDLQTEDLVTLVEFDFSNQQPLLVKVDLPELAAERAIVNICFSNDDGRINRSNCLLQSALDAGSLTAELSLGAHHERLVMEIWRFADLDNPLVYRWSVLDGLLWSVF